MLDQPKITDYTEFIDDDGVIGKLSKKEWAMQKDKYEYYNKRHNKRIERRRKLLTEIAMEDDEEGDEYEYGYYDQYGVFIKHEKDVDSDDDKKMPPASQESSSSVEVVGVNTPKKRSTVITPNTAVRRQKNRFALQSHSILTSPMYSSHQVSTE